MLLSCFLTLSIGLAAFCGDRLLDFYTNKILRAFIDNATHGAVGLLTWAVVVVSLPEGRKYYIFSRLVDVILCGFAACAIDVDHITKPFVKSPNIKKDLLLEHRPLLHCTTLWIAICVICFTLSKITKTEWLTVLCWLLSAASISHHIRDGTRRGLWFWPFGSTSPIPYTMYVTLLCLLPFAEREMMILTVRSRITVADILNIQV
ncbi:transmembrane protein 267-like isoform X2 [Cimex lectularius]|uniref:Transmembrane protein 267 n=1 Tax=Cimex lectularius TaxID=79782 RepID=A0A8I6RU05_CIMLE|nr:transmembrane protein 267-like isoform X2 [Cimex lectularius]